MKPPGVVLWVDPGKLNGFACYFLTTDEIIMDEYSGPNCIRIVENLISYWNVRMVVGVERFIITRETAKKSQDGLASIEMIGMMRRAASLEYVHVQGLQRCRAFNAEQSSSNAKTFVTDRILKELGWQMKGGEGHAEDAARHIFFYLNQNNWLNQKQKNALLPPEE